MASDISKWADHALILSRHSKELLGALYNIKKIIENEATPSAEMLYRGGASDFSVSYKGNTIVPESPPRPGIPRMTLFIDPGVLAIQKQVLKKFPDVGDLGKHETLFAAQGEDFLRDLKPYYKAFIGVAEYIELSIPVIRKIIKFKLTMDNYPQICKIFLDLIKGVVKVLLFSSQIPNLKKLFLFLYNKSYQKIHGESAPGWSTILQFLKTYEKPIAGLSALLEPISTKLSLILLGLENQIKTRVITNSHLLKRSGIWLTYPALYDIKPIPTVKSSCAEIFESLIIGFLIIPDHAAVADLARQALEWGYFVTLARDEVFSILAEIETTVKENSKLSKLKSMVKEANNAFLSSYAFHVDRREYLLGELHHLVGLIHSRKNVPNFLNLCDILDSARDEIMWYFIHVDKDGYGNTKGRRDAKQTDLRVIEMMWLFKYLWNTIAKMKSSFTKALLGSIEKLYQKIVSKLEPLLDNFDNTDDEAAILNDFNRVFSGEVFQENFEDQRMNWLRFQMFTGMNPRAKLEDLNPLTELMEKFYEESDWVDRYEELIRTRSSLHPLYYRQGLLFDHARDILENGSDSLKYVVAVGMVASDFEANVSELWPFEAANINTHSIFYATEFYSVLGQYVAGVAHDFALSTIKYQVIPGSDGINAIVENNKKKNMKKVDIIRPGQESNLREPSNAILQLEGEKHKLRNLMQIIHCGGIPVYDTEFQPFEYFLDAFAAKFKGFLNSGIYLSDIVLSKEAMGNKSSDDVMSFDIKRPSVFVAEIKSYLHAAGFIGRVAGVNVVSVLREIWLEQINLEDCKRHSKDHPHELVFHISHKTYREKGKAVGVNPIQPFLLTLVTWFSEFVGCKGITDSTSFSPLHDSFCNREFSSVQAEYFTDRIEIRAICSLIGIQGLQFFDEKITRMIALLLSQMRQVISQNQSAFEKMKGADEAAVKELSKRIDLNTLASVATSIGVILSFRDLLFNGMVDLFSQKFPDVLGFIDQLSSSKIQDPEIVKSVNVLANQIGRYKNSDGMLKWASSAVANPAKDCALAWHLLPLVYAHMVWQSCYDPKTKYEMKFDGLSNNIHCMLFGFFKILPPIYELCGYSNQIEAAKEEFLAITSSLLLSGWVSQEKELNKDSVQSIISCIHGFAHSSSFWTMDMVNIYLPFSVMKQAFRSLEPAHERGGAAREDDLAL